MNKVFTESFRSCFTAVSKSKDAKEMYTRWQIFRMGVSQTAMCLPFIAFISAASAPRPNPLHMTECDVDVALLQLGLQVNSSVNVSLTSLTGGHETQVEGLQKRWLPQAPHLNDKLGFQFSALVAAVLFLLALIEVLGSCCARGRRAAQFVYLASSILNSAGFTILLMVSLPYTESLGRGEVSSGILVSSNAIGGLAAQLLAPRIIPNEAPVRCSEKERQKLSNVLNERIFNNFGQVTSSYQCSDCLLSRQTTQWAPSVGQVQ